METLLRNQNINCNGTNRKTRFAGIKLKVFSMEQTVDYAFVNALSREITKKMLGIINDNSFNITELLTRSILSKMIKDIFPSLKDKMKINVAGLYQTYTDMWIKRDDWLPQMTFEEKKSFMWQLAHKAYQKKSSLSLHHSQLGKPEMAPLKENFTETNKDYFQYEVATCPFLNCDRDGNYSFIHKSFMEFFLAQYFFHELRNNNRIANVFDFNHETLFFLKSIILLNKSYLQGLDLRNLPLNNVNLEGVNLTGTNLSGCLLMGANLKMAKLCDANLSRATLCDADLSNANLSGANLYKANLGMVNLDGANLSEADLRKADMILASLNGTKFTNANLQKADLTFANLNCTDFSNANLSGAILSKIKLNNSKLKMAKLCGADLSLAILSGIDFGGFDLKRVDLRMADLSHTNFKGANLKNANLSDANCNGAIFD